MQRRSRRLHARSVSTLSCLALALIAPCRRVSAQAPASTPPTEWRAWVFGRIGGGSRIPAPPPSDGGDQTLLALTAGTAASYGSMFAMLRGSYNERISWETPDTGVQDYAALAGVRSRDDERFLAAGVGLALATPIGGSNGLYSLHPDRRLAVAYDLSAHEDWRIGGLALAVSGVLGPAAVRYVALSAEVELGWFGRP